MFNKEEVVLGMTYLLESVFGFLFIILGVVYLLTIIKVQFFNNSYFIKAFKIAMKEDGLNVKRFFSRVYYELKPKSEKQKRNYLLMLYLFIKGTAYILFGFFCFNVDANLICGIISSILFIVNPKVMLNYINKVIK